jgi:hypothetical protein
MLCAAVLCLSPSKAAGYLAPLAAIAVFAWASTSIQTVRRVAFMYAGLLLYMFAFSAANSDFRLLNALAATLTYSGIVVIAVIPSRGLAGPQLLNKVTKLVALIVVIESLVGLIQAAARFSANGSFDTNNGDYIQGTIYPYFDTDGAFANPMFAVNIAMMLLFLLATKGKSLRKRGLVIGFGFGVLLLAGVMHVILMGLVAILLGSLFGMTGRKAMLRLGSAVVFLGVAIGLITVLMPRNLSMVSVYWDSFRGNRNVRTKMVERVVLDMPADYPQLPVIGLGLGQFNSRAAMMMTGRYFTQTVPLPVTETSSAQNAYFMDLWVASNQDANVSSTVKPFFSWLSIYTELGVVGIASAGFAFWMILRSTWRNRWKNPRLAIAVASGCLLFAFLGLQENYWEVPQAVLIGLMLLKLLHANLLANVSSRPAQAIQAVRINFPAKVPVGAMSSRGVR